MERLAGKLAALRENFVNQLPERLQTLEKTWLDFQQQDQNPEALKEIRTMAHRLAGSGGTFGFPALSDRSRELEQFIQGFLLNETVPSVEETEEIEARVSALRRVSEEAMGGGVPEGENASLFQQISPTPSPSDTPDRSVLIVEDDPEQLAAFAAALAEQGWKVHKAADGLDGIRAAFAEMPDLIVSDVMMPGLSGYHLCRFLKSSTHLRETPVVLLTSLGEQIDRFWGQQCGADAFMIKSRDLSKLLALTNTFLSSQATRPPGGPRPSPTTPTPRGVLSAQVAGMLDGLLRETKLREEVARLGRTTASLEEFQRASLEFLAQIATFDKSAMLMVLDQELLVATDRASAEEFTALVDRTRQAIASNPDLTDKINRVPFNVPDQQFSEEGGPYLTAPLNADGQDFGSVCIGRRTPGDDFTAAELGLFELFARELGAIAAAAWGREVISRKNGELQQLTEMKDRLSELLVHDVKNTTWAVGLAVESLVDDPNLSEQKLRTIKEASTGCRLLADMLVSLLDIAKMEEAEFRLNPSLLNTSQLAREVMEIHESRARRRSVALELEDLPEIFADADLIRRILSNLIGNAVKHTQKGRVRVSATTADVDDARDRLIQIEVADTGMGIAPEFQKELFQKYVQAKVQKKGTSTPRGFRLDRGLGLYFCRLAAEAHGGRIWVESALNEGSRFLFLMPADEATFTRLRKARESS